VCARDKQTHFGKLCRKHAEKLRKAGAEGKKTKVK
jgi:hypothetical protein